MLKLQRNETFQSAWYDKCIKSNHPNVFICPNKGLFKIPDKTFGNGPLEKLNDVKQFKKLVNKNVEVLRQGKIYKLKLRN